MLEFNKEHKKADLSNVDINAGKYKRNGKIMLARHGFSKCENMALDLYPRRHALSVFDNRLKSRT